MARAYTVGTVALTLAVPAKWVDNLLSHHRVSGVVQERQGVSRKVTMEGLLQLAVTVSLIQELEIPAANALYLASSLAKSGGSYNTQGGITITLDLDVIRANLETRLAQAVEIAPVPTRGRPPHSTTPPPSKTGRLD